MKVNNNLASGVEQLQLQRFYNDVSFRPTKVVVEDMCGMNIWERTYKNEKKPNKSIENPRFQRKYRKSKKPNKNIENPKADQTYSRIKI